jgi:hypothetical protein
VELAGTGGGDGMRMEVRFNRRFGSEARLGEKMRLELFINGLGHSFLGKKMS